MFCLARIVLRTTSVSCSRDATAKPSRPPIYHCSVGDFRRLLVLMGRPLQDNMKLRKYTLRVREQAYTRIGLANVRSDKYSDGKIFNKAAICVIILLDDS